MPDCPPPDDAFVLNVRVFYEDTDAAGVVYYANYLRYLERARTEWLRALGVEQGRLAQQADVAFAVRSVHVEYLRPARLDDMLRVESRIAALGRVKIEFLQRILRGDDVLIDARVTVACLSATTFKPAALPDLLAGRLAMQPLGAPSTP